MVATPLALALLAALPQAAERVSVSSTGAEANGASFGAGMTPDGRFVAFHSAATNLVPGDTNRIPDVFVRDRWAGTTTRVSLTSGGVQATVPAAFPGYDFGRAVLSAGGRFVAFTSHAQDLVPNDINGAADVFLRDRMLGTTELVSVDGAGIQLAVESGSPRISADGRWVAFRSGDALARVFDRTTGISIVASVDSTGRSIDVYDISLSADGRYLAFDSWDSAVVPGDTNGKVDVFLHDLATGALELVSLTSGGVQVTDHSCIEPELSADGKSVIFHSRSAQFGPIVHQTPNVYLRDLRTGVVHLASGTAAGIAGDGPSYAGSMVSANGLAAGFISAAGNLRPPGLPLFHHPNIYRYERGGGAPELAAFPVTPPLFQYGLPHSTLDVSISADGRWLAFDSYQNDLVRTDLNRTTDVFACDLRSGSGIGTVVMTADLHATVGQPFELRWFCAEPGADWWLIGSQVDAGRTYLGHPFDLGGGPVQLLDHGTVPPSGHGKAYTPALPAALAGTEVHFELVTRTAAGVLGDSNLVSRPVQ